VAENDGQIVGLAHYVFHLSAWAEHQNCYLQDLFVNSSIRGQGVGRSLINAVVERAREAKAGRVYWTTKESNHRARILYDSMATLADVVQYRINLK
jgi:GNAT superfamily N-acetyltransferase